MEYNFYLMGLFVIFLIVYLIIKVRENNLPVISFENFGQEASRPKLNTKQKELIIGQKITHRNIAFYTYWISLIISFGLGCFTIFKLIREMDFKLLHDALLISAGVASTIGFRKLYLKCDKDINNLH